MKWLVTSHAVERFMGRVDRTLSPFHAEQILYAALPLARKLDRLTNHGQPYYEVSAAGRTLLVIGKLDLSIRRMVAVTVLRLNEEEEQEDATPEVLAAYQRANKTPVELPPPTPRPSPAEVKNASPQPAPVVQSIDEGIAPSKAIRRIRHLESIILKLQQERASDAERAAINDLHRLWTDDRGTRDTKRDPEMVERLMAHNDLMEAHVTKLKTVLRAAMRCIFEGAGSHETLAALTRLAPDLASEAFAYPERFTKAERKDQHDRAILAERDAALTVPA